MESLAQETAENDTQKNDAELLRRYVHGNDRQGMDELFKRYSDLAYRVALRTSGGNEADAQEAVQAAFLQAFLNARQYRGQSSVKGWIMKIVVNACRMKIREESARRKREEKYSDDNGREYVEMDQNADTRRTVVNAVAKLPEVFRLPVWMRFFEELQIEEIAEALSIPIGTVKSRVNRGLERLRGEMEGAGVTLSVTALTDLCRSVPLTGAPPALQEAIAGVAAKTIATEATQTSGTGTVGSGMGFKLAVAAGVVVLAGAGALLVRSQLGSASRQESGNVSVVSSVTADIGRPVGWRGNWTGVFPDSSPPVEWGRTAKSPLSGLKSQARKPAEGIEKSIKPLGDSVGLLFDWLVIGPFPGQADKGTALQSEHIPNEGDLRPDEGDLVGDKTWKRSGLVFRDDKPNEKSGVTDLTVPLPAGKVGDVSYACAYVYSGNGLQLKASMSHSSGGLKVWIGDEVIYREAGPKDRAKRLEFTLQKGWNRILLKSSCLEERRADAEKSPQYQVVQFSMCYDIDGGEGSYETRNIAWMRKLPWRADVQANASSPVVIGDRIFLTGEMSNLICLSRKDGRVLWIRSNDVYEAAPDEDRADARRRVESLAQGLRQTDNALVAALNAIGPKDALTGFSRRKRESLDKQLEEKRRLENEIYSRMGKSNRKYRVERQTNGSCSQTCISDGTRVWAYFATGAAVCYDMDGNLLWKTFLENGSSSHHGLHGSPALVDGNFVVAVSGNGPSTHQTFVALDAITGKVAWRQPRVMDECKTVSLVPARISGVGVLITRNGAGMRASDGKILWAGKKFPCRGAEGSATPVAQDGLFYHYHSDYFLIGRLPETLGGEPEFTVSHRIPLKQIGYPISSPVIFNGLMYGLNSGGPEDFFVVDPAQGKIVYSTKLDLRPRANANVTVGTSASCVAAGKYVYVMDNSGVAIVVEPGREFRQVARNSIEHFLNGDRPWMDPFGQEQTFSWAFEGKNIFIRGTEYLYCIGENL